MLKIFYFKERIVNPIVMFILPKVEFFQLSLLSAFVIFISSAVKEKTTLLLVQTLFRHGDRAPVILYPTDPNGEDCWPNGLGELTQLGKKQQYQVGKFLRSMYEDFITSDPNQIYVNSSSEGRCLNSAESNLASFYAPKGKWKLANNLNWQPIPVHYLPLEMDIYLDCETICPRYRNGVLSAMNSKEIQEFHQTHQMMVKDLSNFSGLNFSEGLNAFLLFDTLEAERIHNLVIPEWAETYWDEMNVISYKIFQTFYNSSVQCKLLSGPFLGLITENLKNKISGSTPNLKFIINSSHDVNVAGVLLSLNFTNMPRPPYCATLLFELHEMADASMAVRLFYMNSTNPLVDMEEPHVLVLDGCSEFCPVKYFMDSYQWLIPNNREEECQVDIEVNSPGKIS